MENSSPESISAADLDKMRRELLSILNEAEPQRDPTGREDVCHRIQRLCDDSIIPEAIGDFMHVVRKCRNRAVYQDRLPEGMEARAIWSAWSAIKDWQLSSTCRAV